MVASPDDGRMGSSRAGAPLSGYLTRLMVLGMLPLILVAAWLVLGEVRHIQAERRREAERIAQSTASSLDRFLSERIRAMAILAASPLMDRPQERPRLYREAQGFQQIFGTQVILADAQRRMLFNTRAPLGSALPPLPTPRGRSAFAAAISSGEPAVGDQFMGPVAGVPMISIALPVLRPGRPVCGLLTTLESTQFQDRLDRVPLPRGWALTLTDLSGQILARHAPPGFDPGRQVDASARFTARSAVSSWTLAVEVPRQVWREPMLAAIRGLGAAMVTAVAVGLAAGLISSRRIAAAVGSLGRDGSGPAPCSDIREIASARARLEQARAEIIQLNANLERRVEARTAELAAANRGLEAFAYAVSHDLRAPLRAMMGFAEALEEDCGAGIPQAGRAFIAQILMGGRRMGELIEGLLQLSKCAQGGLERGVVDLSALAEAARAGLEQGDPARRVLWRIEPGLLAMGDARTLRVVMENLLGNAWKYTAHKDPATITFDAVEEGGTRWLRVADNGAGFDMAYVARLFEPFQRLHRQDEFPGLGIGLATVQRIFQRHGGRIEAVAQPGQGATFRFTLP